MSHLRLDISLFVNIRNKYVEINMLSKYVILNDKLQKAFQENIKTLYTDKS